MNPNPTYKRVYEHRIREAVCESGDPNLFPELEIPRSTALSWIRRGCPEPNAIIVALDEADEDFARLYERVRKLDRRVAVLLAVVRLLNAIVRFQLIDVVTDDETVPDLVLAKDRDFRGRRPSDGTLDDSRP